MADPDLSSPLLPSQPSDPPHLILTIHDSLSHNNNSSSSNRESCVNHNHQNSHHKNGNNIINSSTKNPYEFLGSKGLEVCGSSTVDPFLNKTGRIEGLYEWLKLVVCLPVAAVRLVLFGVCLLIGFLATKVALYGWKDRQSAMPVWRSRIMWITRISARFILFSFGYVIFGFLALFCCLVDEKLKGNTRKLLSFLIGFWCVCGDSVFSLFWVCHYVSQFSFFICLLGFSLRNSRKILESYSLLFIYLLCVLFSHVKLIFIFLGS